jgi:hypothetical protein
MHRPPNPHHLAAFCESRISRGSMLPQARGRLSRLFRDVDRDWILSHAPARQECERPRLTSSEVEFGTASVFVTLWHRHLAGPVGHIFSMGVFHEGRLCGVAIAGRPVARHLDDGTTLEITRVATDGTRNACSKLLAGIRAQARRRGFRTLITYTLPQEGGASLRAAGFVSDGVAGGGHWSRDSRLRADRHPTVIKQRWRVALGEKPSTPSQHSRGQ